MVNYEMIWPNIKSKYITSAWNPPPPLQSISIQYIVYLLIGGGGIQALVKYMGNMATLGQI